MPWIDKNICVGCGLCVDYCPTQAIDQQTDTRIAVINDDKCIRCGKCHDICPKCAVRHDSERLSEMVEENISWTLKLMENYNTDEERKNFIDRISRYFNLKKKVANQTIEKLKNL